MALSWPSLDALTDPGTTVGALALLLLVFILTWVACRLTNRLLRRPALIGRILGEKVDETVITYLLKIKNIIIVIVAIFVYASLIPGLRSLVGTMVAGAGVSALVIGLAARSTLANLISGLSLAVYRPFRIGDQVKLEDQLGVVEDITLRHTVITTWDHTRLIIPNEKIDNISLVNYNIIDPRILCRVDLGVSYDTDIDLARRLIIEEAKSCPYRDQQADDEPWVRVTSHGDFSIGIRLNVWTKNVDDFWRAKFWLLENIKKRFDREGVEIPFPYRTVVYKKDLPPPRTEKPVE